MFDDKTHFIGVLPSIDVNDVVEGDRKWVREKYGCKSGHSTPVHVTLVPPFKSDLSTSSIVDILSGILPLLSPFEGKIDGYGSFGDRTVFLRVVPSREWDELSKTLTKGLRSMGVGVKLDKKPLVPHLSVANRDIPPGALRPMLETLSLKNIRTSFPVDSVSIFHREGRLWRVEETIRIG